jgi:AraC-like DNA-binding protein
MTKQNMSETKQMCTFVTIMMTMQEILETTPGGMPDGVWNGQIACLWVTGRGLEGSYDLDGVSVFSFVLVRQGRMSVRYQGNAFDLQPGDIHTYAPGVPTHILEVSEDYQGYCVIFDEQLVLNTPALRHFIRAVYFPIAELGKPKLSLTKAETAQIANTLDMLRHHILKPTSLQREAVFTLATLLSIELLEAQSLAVETHRSTTRAEEVFAAFLRLVPDYYIRHRDLKFYADRLNITTTYLSRIVRQISGRTVVEFLNEALAAEAALRLKTTNRTITQLADDFNFSDQAAFTKFFTRIKSMSPKEYRKSSDL